MPVHNSEIADLFEKLADLLEIDEANPFRIRAYRNAARSVRSNPKNMTELVKHQEDLSKLPDIGKDLSEKIKEIVTTGHLSYLEEVESRLPAVLSEMMQIQGLGPKRVKVLYQNLNIQSLEDLKRTARSGKIRTISGFGEKTERTLLKRAEAFSGQESRTLLIEAVDIAEALVVYLKKIKGAKKVIVAGSYRRCQETVGDLDILVTASKGTEIMSRFVEYDEVVEILSQGSTRSTVQLRCGLSVDLRVVPQVSYGAALHYFTGSKAHNIAVRKMAVKQNLKINEYGVFKGDRRLAGKTEAELYQQVGLPYIEPELRENRGEIEAAMSGRLPDLIEHKDILGDLHSHTHATDGRDSLEQMAQAAAERGYKYLAITDHSRHVTMAHGLNEKRLLQQIKEIDRLNEKRDDIVLLKSIEVDILEDGSLDLPDRVLKELDFTVCAVHYAFNLSSQKQTERILRAMDNPYFTILAHPTGRLLNQRAPYSVDLEKIMQGALERRCFLELNAQPQRLDLSDDACQLAKEIGLKVAISTDAHSTSNLDLMRFGIHQARRGWLEADDVINTRSLSDLKTLFNR